MTSTSRNIFILKVFNSLLTVLLLIVSSACFSADNNLTFLGSIIMTEPELYEFDEWYVYEVIRNSKSEVISIGVSPKYYFEDYNSSWAEPEDYVYLDQDSFDLAIRKIESTLPIGEVVSAGKVGAITNLMARMIDCHENAIVERLVYGGPVYSNVDATCLEDEIVSFRVLFYMKVHGEIVEMRPYSLDHDGKLVKVNIADEWYWFCGDVSAIADKRTSFRLAGPIN
jgi:hypothetical protein